MLENAKLSDFADSSREEHAGLLEAYRHDAHKMNGEPHASAPDSFAGVPVNQDVPHGADLDASLLSRPSGEPQQTVPNHGTHYRLSLLKGASSYDTQTFSKRRVQSEARDLLSTDDAESMHRAWLQSELVAGFNESVYYPHTSLKYHTLLVAALLDCYLDGADFEELRLAVSTSDRIIPHRTVYSSDRFSLLIVNEPAGRPSARLGSRPWQSWASTWNRLTYHPLADSSVRLDKVLDANLRRIASWSVALQYLEDFEREYR